MLVLSRKQGESIEFSGLDVVVRVISLKRSKVQLGIEAPRQISVNRSEKVPGSQRREGTAADRQVLDELARIEAELAALAELAAANDRPAAHRIAADASERVEGIKRSIRHGMRGQSDARPISEFLQWRADLREQAQADSAGHDVTTWPVGGEDRSKCVRQRPSPYAIGQLPRYAS